MDAILQNKISVLIVDDNKEVTNELSSYINTQRDMKVAAVAYNGAEAVKFIQETSPTVVILDIVMPVLDGVGVLMKLDKMFLEKVPKIILLSGLQRGMEMAADVVMNLNISCSLLKPQSPQAVCEAIRDIISQDLKKPDLEQAVTQVLIEFGVPAHIQGYHYCRNAIIMIIKDFDLSHNITTELYPQIAAISNTTPYRVERSIRHAIEVAWKRGNSEFMNQYFGQTNCRPTNAEFLSMTAEKIRLELK